MPRFTEGFSSVTEYNNDAPDGVTPTRTSSRTLSATSSVPVSGVRTRGSFRFHIRTLSGSFPAGAAEIIDLVHFTNLKLNDHEET